MKNFFVLLSAILLLSALTTMSCNKDDDTQTVKIQIAPVYGDMDLSEMDAGELIPYRDGEILLTKFEALISDFSIITDKLELTQVSDRVLLLNLIEKNASVPFEFNMDAGDNAITAEEIQEISFALGLPEDLNATIPADYTSDELLSRESLYWEAWDSYIFSKTEGKFLSADTTGQVGFNFHTGSDSCYVELTLPAEQIEDDQDNEILVRVSIDLQKLFLDENGTLLDLQEYSGFHEADMLNEMIDWMDKLSGAMQVYIK